MTTTSTNPSEQQSYVERLSGAEFEARGLARSRYHDRLFAESRPRPTNEQFDEGWEAARQFYASSDSERTPAGPSDGEGEQESDESYSQFLANIEDYRDDCNRAERGLPSREFEKGFAAGVASVPPTPALEPVGGEAPERIWIAPVAFRARSSSAVIYDESQREPSDVEYGRADLHQLTPAEKAEVDAIEARVRVAVYLDDDYYIGALDDIRSLIELLTRKG